MSAAQGVGRAGINGARGEVEAVLAGHPRRLCLTLGALAEMETGLGVSGLEGLGQRLARMQAGDLALVLAALLRGGREADFALSPECASISVAEAAEAVRACLEAAVK